MDFSSDHIGFVLIAYVLTAVVLAGLCAAIIADTRRQRRDVERLEEATQGRRRRAAEPRAPAGNSEAAS